MTLFGAIGQSLKDDPQLKPTLLGIMHRSRVDVTYDVMSNGAIRVMVEAGLDTTNMDLSGVRFWGPDLTNANLNGCNLTNCCLDCAKLTNCTMWGAQLEGASMRDCHPTGWFLLLVILLLSIIDRQSIDDWWLC